MSFKKCFYFAQENANILPGEFSLSLSLSHTHTHTHTLSLSLSLSLCDRFGKERDDTTTTCSGHWGCVTVARAFLRANDFTGKKRESSGLSCLDAPNPAEAPQEAEQEQIKEAQKVGPCISATSSRHSKETFPIGARVESRHTGSHGRKDGTSSHEPPHEPTLVPLFSPFILPAITPGVQERSRSPTAAGRREHLQMGPVSPATQSQGGFPPTPTGYCDPQIRTVVRDE